MVMTLLTRPWKAAEKQGQALHVLQEEQRGVDSISMGMVLLVSAIRYATVSGYRPSDQIRLSKVSSNNSISGFFFCVSMNRQALKNRESPLPFSSKDSKLCH